MIGGVSSKESFEFGYILGLSVWVIIELSEHSLIMFGGGKINRLEKIGIEIRDVWVTLSLTWNMVIVLKIVPRNYNYCILVLHRSAYNYYILVLHRSTYNYDHR